MIERDENGVRLRGAMLNTHATALLAAFCSSAGRNGQSGQTVWR